MDITPKHSNAASQTGQMVPGSGGLALGSNELSAVSTEARFAGFHCGQCGAQDIQKLSVVYDSGTSIINARTSGLSTGVGVARGGFGLGTAMTSSRTTGTQMSALAKQAAPPQARHGMRWVAIGLVIAILGISLAGIVLTVPLLIVCGLLAYRGVQYDRDVYPGLRRTWEQSWLCHRCGSVSQIAQP